MLHVGLNSPLQGQNMLPKSEQSASHMVPITYSTYSFYSIFYAPSLFLNTHGYVCIHTQHIHTHTHTHTQTHTHTYIYTAQCLDCLCVSHSVVSNSLRPHGPQPARLLCPWNSPGKNTGVGCHSLLQGICLTEGSNLCLPHSRQILYCLKNK